MKAYQIDRSYDNGMYSRPEETGYFFLCKSMAEQKVKELDKSDWSRFWIPPKHTVRQIEIK